jgi:hypothetical protein
MTLATDWPNEEHAAQGPGEIGENGEFPPVDWQDTSPNSPNSPARYRQPAILPPGSIFEDWFDYAQTQLESADCYLAGAILPIAGSILARRIWFPWGDSRQYPNLFTMLAGRAGDRKSSAILAAAGLARRVLPGSAFIPGSFSPETLFDEYCEEEGGQPDKLWIVDEGNAVLADWLKQANGERVASRFLELYDCKPMAESFRRNRTGEEGTSKRNLPETSTSLLFGATFNVARFQGQAVRAGMARRFLYYVADGHGRIITRPGRRDGEVLQTLAEAFARFTSLSGPMDFADRATAAAWDDFQYSNRAAHSACNLMDDAMLSRLASIPMQTLHVAMIFQADKWAKRGGLWQGLIEGDSLDLAIKHVAACSEAAEYLETLSDRARIAADAEVMLDHIRHDFKASTHGGAIYATRSELTKRYCNNSGRAGSWKPDDLYLRLVPALQAQGLAIKCRERGEGGELYAFKPER